MGKMVRPPLPSEWCARAALDGVLAHPEVCPPLSCDLTLMGLGVLRWAVPTLGCVCSHLSTFALTTLRSQLRSV